MGLYSVSKTVFIFVTLSLVSPALQFTHYAPGNSCQIIGDTDVYGIGIRLSYYLNYLAGFVAMLANQQEEIKYSRRAVNVVTLAILINTIRSAVHGSFAILEAYIVFSLVIILPGIVISPYNSKSLTADYLGSGVFFLLYCAYSFCQPWLWFKILYQGDRPGCQPAVFAFYTTIHIYSHGWVIFSRVAAVMACAGAVFTFLFLVLPLLIYGTYVGLTGRDRAGSRVREDAEESEDEEATGIAQIAWFLFKLFCGLSGGSTIAFVEKTIQINNIDLSAPLTDTSQLIPFLIGLFTLVSVLWSVLKVCLHPETEDAGGSRGSLHRDPNAYHLTATREAYQ